MSYQNSSPLQSQQITSSPWAVAHAEESERTAFIRRTYLHLAGAVGAFIGLEVMLFQAFPKAVDQFMVQLSQTPYSWLIVMLAFIGISWIAESWARSTQSQGIQYLGLGLFVVAEAIIFLPLLWYAQRFSPPDTIRTAAILTGVIFGGLTVYTLTTRADFSGLGRYLALGMFAAMGVILCSIVFGMNLSGSLFSSLMILLAAGYVLYETSNVMHRYRTNQHVAASLALFAAVALMFWYVLRLLIAISGRD